MSVLWSWAAWASFGSTFSGSQPDSARCALTRSTTSSSTLSCAGSDVVGIDSSDWRLPFGPEELDGFRAFDAGASLLVLSVSPRPWSADPDVPEVIWLSGRERPPWRFCASAADSATFAASADDPPSMVEISVAAPAATAPTRAAVSAGSTGLRLCAEVTVRQRTTNG